MTKISQAIKEINSNANYSINVDIFDLDKAEITWLNNTPPISKEDIQTKINEITTRDAHIIPRKNNYPSIQEQLDMQYHDIINGTTTWQDAIKAVKDANPKENE
jgi:hypothetical protein